MKPRLIDMLVLLSCVFGCASCDRDSEATPREPEAALAPPGQPETGIPAVPPAPPEADVTPAPASSSEPAARSPRPKLVVDRDKSEVAIPGIFVNPTQKLEVFACHESGPLHETVVAFRVSGEKIYQALLEVGFRSPDAFWNAADEDEVRRTLGDRALLSLRWEDGGKTRELPAEKVIRETDSGLPLFVRGFTFGAKKRLMGDPPVARIPPAVEVTIGDPNRQGSISSLLFHPNDLPALTAWVPALEVDGSVVGDLEQLVERVAPCTVVIRRITSEVDFLDVDLAHETDPTTRAGVEALKPLARQIDVAKAKHAERIGEIQRFLSAAESGDGADGAEPLVALVRQARLDAARIHELYIRLFAAQEKLRTDRIAAMTDLDAEVRSSLISRYEYGVAFEPLLARINVQLAELESAGVAEGSKNALTRAALEFDRERLPIERTLHWAARHLDETESRIAELRANKEEILERLFVEDRLRTLADIRKMKARVTILTARAAENRAKVAGSWEGAAKTEIVERRRNGEALEALADLELDYVKVLEDSRWLENTSEGVEPDSAEAKESAAERKRLDARRAELEKEIAARKAKLN